MRYRRTPIEIESPEQLGYSTIRNNLAESSFSDMCLADYGVDADLGRLLLPYGDHLGAERLRQLIAEDGDSVSPDHVLVTAGAAAALFIIATSLLGPKRTRSSARRTTQRTSRLRAPSAQMWRPSSCASRTGGASIVEDVASRLRPETRLVSITYPHNPTGSMITPG